MMMMTVMMMKQLGLVVADNMDGPEIGTIMMTGLEAVIGDQTRIVGETKEIPTKVSGLRINVA